MDLLDFISRHVGELTGQKKSNGDLIDIGKNTFRFALREYNKRLLMFCSDWTSNGNKMSTEEKVLMCIYALSHLMAAHPGM